MYETPLVQLQPEGEWSADIDAIVVYSQLRPFPTSSWDWIGLYKVSETLPYTSGGNINAKTGSDILEILFYSSLYLPARSLLKQH